MDPEKVNYHYCDDLPTSPLKGNNKIFVTGANGYIARRLIPELVCRGYVVRCMLRKKRPQPLLTHPRIEYVYADCLNREDLYRVLKGIDAAYYLIHSMRLKKSRFSESDRIAAENFVAVAEARGIKRIIYLGGLGESGKKLSPHLKSRLEVGETLAQSRIPVISLQAAIIIGTGSASYELLKTLIYVNRWIPFLPEFNSKCQPIAIRDVIKYLVGVLEKENLTSRNFQIGGQDIFTYKELVTQCAKHLNRKIRFFNVSWVPFPIPVMCNIYAWWLHLFNSIPVNITCLLLDSLRFNVVCENSGIKEILPFKPLDFKTAVDWAQKKEKNSQVFSHWSDVRPEHMADHLPMCEYESQDFFVEEHSVMIPARLEKVFQTVCRVGGANGWMHAHFLWELRGRIDRLFGGVGLRRGRRGTLRVGDSVDFWRVERLEENKELLLQAELVSPGLLWLQFKLEPIESDKSKLVLRAHFIPSSLWGDIYWRPLSKFHSYIFRRMLKFFHKESLRPAEGEGYA